MWFLPSVEIGAHEHCELIYKKRDRKRARDII